MEFEEATQKWNRYFSSDEEIAKEEKYKREKEAFDLEIARLDLVIKGFDTQREAYANEKVQLAEKEIIKHGTPNFAKAILEFLGYHVEKSTHQL